jgi:hypothetical protein
MTDTTARLATTAALSPANTYASGVLTAGSNAALSVDGVAVNAGDVILVKNEAAAANNGLYTVTAAGSAGAVYVLTRHVDMSTSSEFVGAFVPVGLGGTANSNSLWLANPATPFQLGTTAVPFTQLNAATSYTAGNGINIAGNVVSAVGNANNVTVSGSGIAIAANYAGQTSITTLGTVTIGTWNGSLVGAQYRRLADGLPLRQRHWRRDCIHHHSEHRHLGPRHGEHASSIGSRDHGRHDRWNYLRRRHVLIVRHD